jgi:pimeloyl-ACP methyl ester carboxylesterase
VKEVLAVAGYGDATEYIEFLTWHWRLRYGLKVYVYPFGTAPNDQYKDRWTAFERALHQLGKTSIIGISFGFGPAMRAKIEHPDLVGHIVGISAPHSLDDMDMDKVERDYPMLIPSLKAVDMDRLPVEDVMTVRPLSDGTVSPEAVIIPGARNERVPAGTHGGGIGLALTLKAGAIARFLKEGLA